MSRSLLKRTIKLFHGLDFFGLIPSSSLSFKGSKQYHTNTTVVFSLIILIMSCLAFFKFSYNMINKTKNQTIVSEIPSLNPPRIQLTKENFFFPFSIGSAAINFANFINASYYTVDAVLFIKEGKNIKTKPLSIDICDSSDVPIKPDLNEYFKLNSMENMFCIKNYSEVFMQGRWDSSFFQDIEISIYPCKNSSKNPIVCATPQEMAVRFEEAYFTSYIPTALVDPNNYEQPAKLLPVNYYERISLKSSLSVELGYQITEVITDYGAIFEEYRYEQVLKQSYTKSMFAVTTENNDPSAAPPLIFKVFARYDSVQKNYYRKYDKIQEVLAQTGGIIKVLLMTGFLLCYPSVKFNFHQDLAHEVYDFGNESPKIARKLSYCDLIRSYFTNKTHPLNQAKTLTQIGNQNIESKLDIIYIMKKFIEYDKLKFILLNDDQMKAFEKIPKPRIGIKEKEEKDTPFLEMSKMISSSIEKPMKNKEIVVKNKEKIRIKLQAESEIDSKLFELIRSTPEKKNQDVKIELESRMSRQIEDDDAMINGIPQFLISTSNPHKAS